MANQTHSGSAAAAPTTSSDSRAAAKLKQILVEHSLICKKTDDIIIGSASGANHPNVDVLALTKELLRLHQDLLGGGDAEAKESGAEKESAEASTSSDGGTAKSCVERNKLKSTSESSESGDATKSASSDSLGAKHDSNGEKTDPNSTIKGSNTNHGKTTITTRTEPVQPQLPGSSAIVSEKTGINSSSSQAASSSDNTNPENNYYIINDLAANGIRLLRSEILEACRVRREEEEEEETDSESGEGSEEEEEEETDSESGEGSEGEENGDEVEDSNLRRDKVKRSGETAADEISTTHQNEDVSEAGASATPKINGNRTLQNRAPLAAGQNPSKRKRKREDEDTDDDADQTHNTDENPAKRSKFENEDHNATREHRNPE
jgi:hypothetical protein